MAETYDELAKALLDEQYPIKRNRLSEDRFAESQRGLLPLPPLNNALAGSSMETQRWRAPNQFGGDETVAAQIGDDARRGDWLPAAGGLAAVLLGAAAPRGGKSGAPGPAWEKWGARVGKPVPMENETQMPLLTTEGKRGGSINYREAPEAVYIEGAMGGGRENKGQASRAIKALMEYAAANGKPVIATKTEGARSYWNIMGFRHDGINSVFDADQLAKVRSGEVNSTILGHERGYGDMFEHIYGPNLK